MGGLLSARAQSPSPRSLSRLNGPVQVDGRITEPAWQDIEPLPMTMYQPTYQGEMSERTDIRVAYDDTHLYVAGRLLVSDRSDLRANSLYRDRYSGDDTFAIIIDPFNDNENALWFFTTPTGVRVDLAVSNDAEGGFGGAVNSNWDTFWTSAATQTDRGWFAEMRIPLSSLGFQSDGDQVEMGLIVYRFLAKGNRRHIYPSIPPDWNLGFAKPSQARDVALHNVDVEQPLYVTPYALAGADVTTESGDADRQRRSLVHEVGGDLRYNLSPNLTLDLTANTDFAQVEADPQRVNLTRFSLFFPEKRRFFQERASTFEFNTGGNDRLFNSRRIGLVDGEPVRIWGGARLVGRVGAWDLGVLNMQTAADEGLDVPSENFGVARLRRRAFNETSYVGGILTSRVGMDGTYNVAYGLDGVIRVVGDEYLTVKGAQTVDHALVRSDALDPADATLGLVRWERRRSDGLHYQTTLTRAGADYRPDVGFITRRDFTELGGDVAYGHFPEGTSLFRRITPRLSGTIALRNEDGSAESMRLEHAWEWAFAAGQTLRPSVEVRMEDLRSPLDFPENTTVPAARYTFGSAGLQFGPSDGSLLRMNAGASVGSFFDGWRVQGTLSPTWNPSMHLELGGTYEVNAVRFPNPRADFVTHVARLRALVAVNKEISVDTFLQYNSVAEAATADLRFRYNAGEGKDLWIVYDEAFALGESRRTTRLSTQARSLRIKLTYTFTL